MKIMAIDYGDAHTGIAISDATAASAPFAPLSAAIPWGVPALFFSIDCMFCRLKCTRMVHIAKKD